MVSSPPTDRTVIWALTLVTLTVAGTAWCVGAALAPPSAPLATGGTDLRLYRAIVEHVHAGESYYDAAGRELRAYGYATGSVFNWRVPTYAWVIGALPSPSLAKIILASFALVALLLAYAAIQKETGQIPATISVLLLLGVFQWCVDGDAFLSQELWAGVLITLSIGASAKGCWRIGVTAGLAALFFRELALPYCIVAAVLARRGKRRPEWFAWLAGFACYGILLAFHASQVLSHISSADRVPESWVRFGGAPFLLATCRMNLFLFVLPMWVSAFYLPLALLGLAGWRGETGMRVGVTAAAYVMAFAVVGQPFNNYWGLMLAPLLAFGIAGLPTILHDVCQALHAAHRPAAALQ
jgi:hypothetical protein